MAVSYEEFVASGVELGLLTADDSARLLQTRSTDKGRKRSDGDSNQAGAAGDSQTTASRHSSGEESGLSTPTGLKIKPDDHDDSIDQKTQLDNTAIDRRRRVSKISHDETTQYVDGSSESADNTNIISGIDWNLPRAKDLRSFANHVWGFGTTDEVAGLARDLVGQKKITLFQAAALYDGNADELQYGDYILVDDIGSGGMARVFKVKHRLSERTFALKRMAVASTDTTIGQRFYREMQAAIQLDHPNIVKTFDVGERDGMPFLVMEFIDGMSLRSLPKACGPVSVENAVDHILQTARGLQYAHENGIFHRDIKPSNLILDRTGDVKILDMGLALFEDMDDEDGDPTSSGTLTLEGETLGTLNYLAPEQAEDAHNVDGRTDIYSLGCTLYYLLNGKPPYHGDDHFLIIFAHQSAPIPSLCSTRSDVPESLDAIYRKMLAKKPDDRYQTVAELIADLQTVLP